jgi:LemA protein
MLPIVVILLVLVIFAVVTTVGIYNSLVALRNQLKNSFSQIDVQLKRRYDLIPNLVESTKAYLKHERETLEAVIQNRNAAFSANQKLAGNPADPKAMKSLIGAESMLGQSLSKLMAVVEAYPDLKANESINQLKEELVSTENKVAFARQAYNDSVMSYNTARETFPNSLLANTFNFQEAPLFELTRSEEREVPKVSFG